MRCNANPNVIGPYSITKKFQSGDTDALLYTAYHYDKFIDNEGHCLPYHCPLGIKIERLLLCCLLDFCLLKFFGGKYLKDILEVSFEFLPTEHTLDVNSLDMEQRDFPPLKISVDRHLGQA